MASQSPIMRPVVVAFLCATLPVSGCASAPGYFGPDRVEPSRMRSHLVQKGYSVARPPNNAWYLLVSEQHPERLIIRRGHLEADHSAFVSITLDTETADVTSSADLVSMISGQYRSTERIMLVRKTVVPDEHRTGICVDFDVLGEDNTLHDGAGAPFRISYVGFACVHPTFPGRVVTAMYSERAPGAEFGESVPGDAKAILDSVVLESAPGTPASAEAIE